MKIIIFLFLFATSTSFSQNKDAIEVQTKLIHKWNLEQFEEVERKNGMTTISKTKYAENVIFEFKKDQTLEVVYSDSKIENYTWKIKKKYIEILPLNNLNFNSEISGTFEIYFHDKISQVFLQRKNDPHHGIMLKI